MAYNELEALRKENAEMKADIKLLKDSVLEVTDVLEITEKGVLKKGFEVSDIFGVLTKLTKGFMFNQKAFMLKFEPLKKLMPVLAKYNNI